MMLGISDHNIEVGVAGVKQGISVVSCGWLFFFEKPGEFFWFQVQVFQLLLVCMWM